MNISRLAAVALVSTSAMALTACGQSADNSAPITNEAMSSGASGAAVDSGAMANSDAMSANDSMSASGAMSEGAMKDSQADAMKGGAMESGNAMTDKH
jgi:hypothetical protein